MKVSNIYSTINFGKTAVATCNVKEKDSKKLISATIFQMDPLDEKDYKEIKFSKYTKDLQYGVETERENGTHNNRGREFYLVKANKNGEVVACAQTLHRYRANNASFPGLSTMVEEISENYKFDNPALPLMGYITQIANERYDKSIISIVGTDESPRIQKKLKLKETENEGVFVLSKRRFDNFIKKAQEKSQLEFLA